MPTQYKILQGDTLSQIALANQTDITTLQKLNPTITDPNKIMAGATLNLPAKPSLSSSLIPTGLGSIIATSSLARDTFDKNVNVVLPKMESQYNPQTQMRDPVTGQVFDKPIAPTKAGEVPPPPPPPAPITFKSDNPAFQSLIDQANKVITDAQTSGAPLTPEAQQRINEINNFNAQKTAAVAAARTAADNKDAAAVDTALTEAKIADTSAQDAINALIAEQKTARESYVASLTPSDKEIQLKQSLNTLRTERKLMPMELRREGISAIGIGGRIIEDERTRAIQESNLLFEIGLEQDARQYKSAAIEKQMSWLTDDINLQMKIQDKLDVKEKDVLAEARNLRKDSLTALASILDDQKGFGGLDWQDIGQDPQAQADLMNLIKPYPDLTVSLVSKALSNVKQQIVFNNAIKAKAQEKKPSETEINAENYDQAKQDAILLFEEDRQRNDDKKVSPDLYKEMRNKVPITLRDDFDKWAIDRNYLSEETIRKHTTLGTVEAKPKTATVDKNKVGFVVDSMMKDNENVEEITNYIRAEGYDPADDYFGRKLEGYQPEKKKSWWKF